MHLYIKNFGQRIECTFRTWDVLWIKNKKNKQEKRWRVDKISSLTCKCVIKLTRFFFRGCVVFLNFCHRHGLFRNKLAQKKVFEFLGGAERKFTNLQFVHDFGKFSHSLSIFSRIVFSRLKKALWYKKPTSRNRF